MSVNEDRGISEVLFLGYGSLHLWGDSHVNRQLYEDEVRLNPGPQKASVLHEALLC